MPQPYQGIFFIYIRTTMFWCNLFIFGDQVGPCGLVHGHGHLGLQEVQLMHGLFLGLDLADALNSNLISGLSSKVGLHLASGLRGAPSPASRLVLLTARGGGSTVTA
jgi:hypothetical protein